jgi:hypothetical protein
MTQQKPQRFRRKVSDDRVKKVWVKVSTSFDEVREVLEADAEVIEGRVEHTTHQRLIPRPLTIFRHTDGRIWRRALTEEQFRAEYEEIT